MRFRSRLIFLCFGKAIWIDFALLSKITCAYLCDSISMFSILSHSSVCYTCPLPVPHWLMEAYYQVERFLSCNFSYLKIFFFYYSSSVFTILVPFYIKFRIYLSVCTKNLARILIALNPSLDNFTILSLLIHGIIQ